MKFLSWCGEHPFLTFFVTLILSNTIIGVVCILAGA